MAGIPGPLRLGLDRLEFHLRKDGRRVWRIGNRARRRAVVGTLLHPARGSANGRLEAAHAAVRSLP